MSSSFRAVSVADYEDEAKKRLSGDALCFLNSGSDGQETYDENVEASKRYRLRPRVLQNISHVDLSSSILGHPIAFPICVAPSAWHKFQSDGAEIDTAKGVTDAGVAMTLSSVSTTTSKELTSSFPNGLFFMQAYVMKNKKLQELMLRDLKRQGFKAVVLSVDCIELSKRRTQLGESMVERLSSKEMRVVNYIQEEEDSQEAAWKGPRALLDFFYEQVHRSPPVSLDYIHWLKSCCNLPIIVKGILTGKAARLVAGNGADAVWISNHGGRQLNFTPSTLDVLSEVVSAVSGTGTEVYIDSGFRTGSDVFKALALGAKAVFIGRPVLWGLAVRGSDGVYDVLNILKDELRQCMALSGCQHIKSITSNHVISESSYLASKL